MLQPVQLFKILSDETRLAIMMLLRESGEMCMCDICAATAESQPKISRHRAILREAELVLDRREGNGSTTGSLHICPHGRQKLSQHPGTACGKMFVSG